MRTWKWSEAIVFLLLIMGRYIFSTANCWLMYSKNKKPIGKKWGKRYWGSGSVRQQYARSLFTRALASFHITSQLPEPFWHNQSEVTIRLRNLFPFWSPDNHKIWNIKRKKSLQPSISACISTSNPSSSFQSINLWEKLAFWHLYSLFFSLISSHPDPLSESLELPRERKRGKGIRIP